MKIKDVARVNRLNVTVKYPHSEIEYIDTSSVTQGVFDSPQKIRLNDAPLRAKRIVRHNDILISTVRPNLKHFGICKKPSNNTVASTGFAVITCDDIFPDYLYRLLTTNWYTEFLSGIAESQQSNYPAFNPSLIENTGIEPPSLGVQKKIAAILTSYDDLIENNRRRIALLEKMAEEIYREWFVRLRFPGYEKVKIIKGVPEDWQVLPFSQLVIINPIERIDKSEDVPFVGMEVLSLSSMFFIPKEMRKGGQGAKFRNDDVLFPRITPSVENGKRGFVMTLADGQVGFGSTEFIVLREKVISAEHIYFLTCSSDFRGHAELSMTGASGRQRVQEECFSFFLVKTPPPEIRQQFFKSVRPHFSQIGLLSRQIEDLIKARDLLLPRLISGKLSVEHLDIQFPPSMAEELKTDAAHA